MSPIARRSGLLFGRAAVAFAAAVLLLVARPASATTILAENFDNVAGLVPGGWAIVNNSSPLGTTAWFQGNADVFAAQSGAPTSYAAANFNAAVIPGNISDWLITPTLTLTNGTTVTFYTRTELNSPFPDRLELRLSLNGSSANVGATNVSVGDFTTLLVTVNPTLSSGGYPESWVQISTTISGLGGPTSGRLAFRYNVSDNLNHGDYIGIDTLSVDAPAPAVPEPATLVLLATGLGAAARLRRRRQPLL